MIRKSGLIMEKLKTKDIKEKIEDIKTRINVENPFIDTEDLKFVKTIKEDDRKSVGTLVTSLRKHMQKTMDERKRLEQIYSFEHKLWSKGVKYVVGVDEAGRGPLAGPVVAAAVVLPEVILKWGIDDSKKMNEKNREELYEYLMNRKDVKIGVGMVSHDVIDNINILNATHLAMKQAFLDLKLKDYYLLVDGMKIKGIDRELQDGIIKGDSKSASIACASIIAKVTRDRLMKKMSDKFSNWKFDIHKGYGTKLHMDLIEEFGPSPIHRLSFKGVKKED